jgi:hypothetical protein
VAEMQANKCDLAILQRWWGEDPIRYDWEHDGQISESLLLYFYVVGLEKRWGVHFYEVAKKYILSRKSDDYKTVTLPILNRGPVLSDVFTIMDALRQPGCDDRLVRRMIARLYHIYDCRGRIGPGDFSIAVEKVLTQGDYPVAEMAAIRRRLHRLARETRNSERQRISLWYSLPATIVFNQDEWVP